MESLPALVKAAQSGDLEAFAQLVTRFQDMAYALAYAMLGDAQLAEDAAQEAFIEAYLCLPRLREPAAFAGWFRRIVFKQGDRIARRRVRGLARLEDVAETPDVLPEPAALIERQDLQRLVQDAVAALPETHRFVTQLFYLADFSQEEIATVLQLPVTTVKKRLYAARQRLRERLEEAAREYLHGSRPSRAEQFSRKVQFFIAVWVGDVQRARTLLAADPALVHAREEWDDTFTRNLYLENRRKFTPLHRAAANGNLPLVGLLLDYGADVNAAASFHETPLHLAVLSNHLPIVSRLLTAGALVNLRAHNGMTPLHWAVMRGHEDIAVRLVDAGADSSIPDQLGQSPLKWAEIKRNQKLMLLLQAARPVVPSQ